jgi:hypothetical protein
VPLSATVVAREDAGALTTTCSKRFVIFVEMSWIVLTLMTKSITSVVKLHPTKRLLFTSRVAI